MTAVPNPEPPKDQKPSVEEEKAKQRTLQMQLYRNRFIQFWHDNFSWPQLLNYMLIFSVTVGLGWLLFRGYHQFNVGSLISDLELKTYDLRFQNLGIMDNLYQPSDDIAIIEFDDTSMMVLGEDYGTWPWPREVHAEMMDYFDTVGAKGVVYDIMFVGYQKGLKESDLKFADAFKRHKNTYIAMNFDTELEQFMRVKESKGMTQEAFLDEWNSTVESATPLSVPFKSNLTADSGAVQKLDGSDTYIFDNKFMLFDHFRSVMPELMETGERIGFINHARDNDSISRGNPLFFILSEQMPVKSKKLPLHFDEAKQQWFDAANQLVSEDGYLLEYKKNAGTGENELVKKRAPVYKAFPYLGLKYAMDLAYPNQPKQYSITKDGQLKVNDKIIPLRRDGVFLINWYNQNWVFKANEERFNQLSDYSNQLYLKNDKSEKVQAEIERVEKQKNELDDWMKANENKMKPYPYIMISAMDVITAINNERRGHLTDKDKMLRSFLKDKILFIGLTAVAQYDIKSTPVHPHLPGVLVQATLFDNIRQGHFMIQADRQTNTMALLLLCLVAFWIVYKFKSAMAALFTVIATGVLYVVVAVGLFKYSHFWLDIMSPMVSMTVVTVVSLVGKHWIADKMYKKTYQMATTDPMTGLYNFRFFKEIMPKCMAEADRTKSKFSLILIDIDHFKKFNDTHGHQAGDEVLRCVARKLRETVRSNDYVIRYGGEEMGIVLDKAPEDVALRVAQKVVEEIAKDPYPIAEGVEKHVTISVGVATYPTHGKNLEELVEFADQGLYRAKDSGRNRVGAQYDDGTVKGAGH